jgi:nucleoside-diphosphate-sugar epimerase
VLQKSYIPVVGQGKARWNNVHVADLSEVFRLLVNKAISKDTDPEIWGPKGYMFTENGEHTWTELSKVVANAALKKGYISEPKEYSLSKDEALEQAGFEAVSWGLNSRGKAERARKVLGWRPNQPSLEEEVPKIVDEERERLGK